MINIVILVMPLSFNVRFVFSQPVVDSDLKNNRIVDQVIDIFRKCMLVLFFISSLLIVFVYQTISVTCYIKMYNCVFVDCNCNCK